MNRGVMLSTKLDHGIAFAHGLKDSQLQRIQIISPSNYNALIKCPNSVELGSEEGLFVKANQILEEAKRDKLQSCGFQDLHILPKQLENSQELKAEFNAKELYLKANGIRIRHSFWENGKRHLTIDESPYSQNEVSRLLSPLTPYFKIKEQKTPQPGNTLIVEVTLFEFFRSAADSLGIDWPEQLKIFSLANPFDLKGLNSERSLSINFNQMQGLSKILAKPRLRVQAGESATFQSGGEIPVTIITENIQQTSWKPYGLLLDLKLDPATKAGEQEINLNFKIELSEPQMSQGTETLPSIQTRKLESRFDLRINETTLLSSMTQQRSGENKSGVYGLMNLPIAGGIFSKKGSQNQSSELWFAIRPTWEDMPYTREMKDRENGFKKF